MIYDTVEVRERCRPTEQLLALPRSRLAGVHGDKASHVAGFADFYKGWLIMPTLLPSVDRAWSCSECQAAFDMEPLDELSLTQVQIERINHVFELHCQYLHRGSSPVSGAERDE